MSDGFNRYISVVSNNLGKDAKLLFIFDVLKTTEGAAYKSYFPVVWKVFDFPAQGYKYNNLNYKNEVVWVKPSVDLSSRIATDTSNYVVVPVGQQTNLVSQCGVVNFTPPTPYSDPTITQANNFTWTCQDVGLGFVPPNGGNPVYVVHFVDVAPSASVKAGIGHNCRAYIVNGYDFKEGQIVTSPIWSYITPIWQQGLGNLNESTTLYLTYNSSTSKYSLSTTRGLEFDRVKEIGMSGKELKERAKEEAIASRRR